MKLLTHFIGFCSFFGFIAGTVSGIVFYVIIFQFMISIFILHLALLGAGVGIVMGGGNGMMFFLIASIFRRDRRLKLNSYKWVMLLTAVISTASLGFSFSLIYFRFTQ